MRIKINQAIVGSILDIGGGGEGIIGRIFGDQVIAIDNVQEELDEAPDCCEKRLMDATDLQFPNQSFDNITFFYALMYMTPETQKQTIREAARVLTKGGRCYIWDTKIDSAYPEPFILDLEIVSDVFSLQTSYGIVKAEGQDADIILQYLQAAGFTVRCFESRKGQFFIACEASGSA